MIERNGNGSDTIRENLRRRVSEEASGPRQRDPALTDLLRSQAGVPLPQQDAREAARKLEADAQRIQGELLAAARAIEGQPVPGNDPVAVARRKLATSKLEHIELFRVLVAQKKAELDALQKQHPEAVGTAATVLSFAASTAETLSKMADAEYGKHGHMAWAQADAEARAHARKQQAADEAMSASANQPASADKTTRAERPANVAHEVRYLVQDLAQNPGNIDEILQLAKDRIGKLDKRNPVVREEIRKVVGAFRSVERKLNDKSLPPERIAEWASQALQHWSSADPALAMQFDDEQNPFHELATLNTPLITQTLQDLAKDFAELDAKRPKQITPYANIGTQAAHYGAMASVAGLTWIAFNLGNATLKNAMLKAIQAGKESQAVVSVMSAPFRMLGYEPTIQTAVNAASWASPLFIATLMLIFIPNRANKAVGVLGRYYQLAGGNLGYVLSFLALAGFSSMTIFEFIGNTDKAKAYADTVGKKMDATKPPLEKIPGIIETARTTVIQSVLERALAESKDGFGKKTMSILYAGGLLHDSFKKFIEENETFIKTLSPDLQNFVKLDFKSQFEAYARTRPQQKKDWEAFLVKFAKLSGTNLTEQNAEDALKIPQALQKFAAAVLPLQDVEGAKKRTTALDDLSRGAKSLGKADALKAFISSLHITPFIPAHIEESFGLEEVPGMLEIDSMKASLVAAYAPYIERYERLRSTDATEIAKHVRAIAGAAGFTVEKDKAAFEAMAAAFMRLDALPISSSGFREEMRNLQAPAIETAIEVILSENGWRAIADSIDKTGLNTYLQTWGISLDLLSKEMLVLKGGVDPDYGEISDVEFSKAKMQRSLVVFSVLLVYGLLIDLAIPDFGFIKVNDVMRERRLMASWRLYGRKGLFRGKGEILETNEEIDELLHELATKTVDRIDAFYSKAEHTTGRRGEYGAAIGRDLRIAHVRGRLVALMEQDLATPASANVAAEQARYVASGEIPGVMEALNRTAAAFLSPANAVLEQLLSFQPLRDERRSRKNEQVAWLSGKLKSYREGDIAELYKLTAMLYPNFVHGNEALAQATFSEDSNAKLSAAEQITEAVRAMSIEELAVAIPEVATEIAVLERAAQEIEKRSKENLRDPQPIIPGQRISLTEDYVEQTFVLGTLYDDLKRYRRMLEEMRAEGRKIATEAHMQAPNADPAAVRIPSLFESTIDNSWIEAKLSDQQLQSLVTLARERIGFITEAKRKSGERNIPGSFTLKEINDTVNQFAQMSKPLLDTFTENIATSQRWRLVGKNFFLAYGYSPLVEGPTVMLYAADPATLGEGRSQQVIGVPFPGRIPDPTGKTVEETLTEFGAWLANGGDAMNTLDAQLMEPRMAEVRTRAQELLSDAFDLTGDAPRVELTPERLSEMTATLTSPEGNVKYRSENLMNLARVRRTDLWFREHAGIVEGSYLGVPVTPKQIGELVLHSLQVPTDAGTSDAEYYVLVEDARAIASTLEYIRSKLPIIGIGGKPLKVEYDPKPVDGPEIVFTNSTGKKTMQERIKITDSVATIERALNRLTVRAE